MRTTIEALAAVLGGAQSLHTNGYDEALALPTEASARLALRTQQILADETGVASVVDPVGGSYAVEALTAEIEARAAALIAEIDAAAAWWPPSRRASRSGRSSVAPSSTSARSRAARASSSA